MGFVRMLIVTCVVCVLLVANAAANVILIDDFSPPNGLVTTVGAIGNFIAIGDFVSGGLGGQRDIVAQRTGAGTEATTSISGGFLAVTLKSGGISRVHWDGTTDTTDPVNNNSGLSPAVNFTLANAPVFVLQAAALPPAAITWKLRLFDASTSQEATFSAFGPGGSLGGFIATIPFSAFAGVSLAAITGVTLSAEGVTGQDLNGSVTALFAGIPEPTSVLVWGLSFVGVGGLLRRKRRSVI